MAASAAVAATGALAVVCAESITARVVDLLPDAATAAGAGTNFPDMATALPPTLRAAGVLLFCLPVVAWSGSALWARSVERIVWSRRASWALAGALGALGFVVFAWYAYPPNMFPSNARIHWVDIFFIRRDDFFYTLVKVHRAFYDVPHLFQAGLGAANAVVLFLIGRAIWDRGPVPVLLPLSFLGATLMMLFATAAEDVHLSLLPLLLAYLAHLRRRPFIFGSAAFVAILARPPFVFVVIAVGIAEVVCDAVGARQGGVREAARRVRSNRFLWSAAAAFTALFVAWNVVLLALDANWLLGGSYGTDALLAHEPIEVDGFTLSAFSGAFVLRTLWIGIPTVIVANLVVASRIASLREDVRRALVGGWLFTSISLVHLEAQPLNYFNIRYITYVWPFLLIGGWAVLALPELRGRPRLAVALAALLLLAPATLHREDLELRRRVVQDPYSSLFVHRHELRELADGRVVFRSDDRTGVRNYLSYIFQRPPGEIQPLGADGISEPALLITTDPDPVVPGGRIVLEAGEVRAEQVDP